MSDEEKKDTNPEEAQEAAPKKSGGMMKYIIMGGIGLVLTVAIAFATLMFLGGGDAPAEANQEAAATEQHAEAPAREGADQEVTDESHDDRSISDEDSILALLEEDESVMENIMSNLEILDYEPTPEDMGVEEEGLSKEDSIKETNWIESEKKRLNEWDAELTKREKELETLDRSVSKKILRIEQAESSRIAQLAKLYDGMEPRSVAELIANLDDETVVSLLPRMKAKSASAALQLMPAKRAARLSKKMITIAEN